MAQVKVLTHEGVDIYLDVATETYEATHEGNYLEHKSLSELKKYITKANKKTFKKFTVFCAEPWVWDEEKRKLYVRGVVTSVNEWGYPRVTPEGGKGNTEHRYVYPDTPAVVALVDALRELHSKKLEIIDRMRETTKELEKHTITPEELRKMAGVEEKE